MPTSTPARLTPTESVRLVTGVLLPLVAQGAIVRRPRVTAWAERRQVDRSGGSLLASLRGRYDGAPLELRLGPRSMVVATAPEHVETLLAGSPDPFTPASAEKRAALAHFQPDGVLISSTEERAERRPFNEAALDMAEPVHSDGAFLSRAVDREVTELLEDARVGGGLDWERFAGAFWRAVRTLTLGERARHDERVTELLDALRRDANWAFLRPRRPWLRTELDALIEDYVSDAEDGTLAARARRTGSVIEAAGQIPHWLFAFDAAGAAVYRTLAVLASRPDALARVRGELEAADGDPRAVLGYSRGCVLESVRLWPTTLAILRESTRETTWGGRTLPAGTGFVVVSSFFHRDAERLDVADDFAPEAWLDGRADADWGLVPFSAGPVSCPGRNVVLLVASRLLAGVATGADLSFERARYLADAPLPKTVDHFRLRFGVRTGRHVAR
ncbi:cytochrome P450 [Oerskovia flava]|uniref:cytochrome P450 n=1 Tax=Oerskovia flava TaxID=2986422 RepID=UPI00223FAF73|nr:cytochrome P450 [Oerskovia sp. JB1-3-2]